MPTEVRKLASEEDQQRVTKAVKAAISELGPNAAGVIVHAWFNSTDKDLVELDRNLYMNTGMAMTQSALADEKALVMLRETPKNCENWAARMIGMLTKMAIKHAKEWVPEG